jgi:hypothetical protein
MSNRRANTVKRVEELSLIMTLALIAPLIISFLVWMVATAFTAPAIPAVGYGLNPVCTVADGSVSYLWLTQGAVTGSPAVCGVAAGLAPIGPSLPTVAINALNSILVILAVLVAVIAGIRMAPSLVELTEEM